MRSPYLHRPGWSTGGDRSWVSGQRGHLKVTPWQDVFSLSASRLRRRKWRMGEHGKCHPCLGHRHEFRDSIGVYQSRQACGRPASGLAHFSASTSPGEKLLEGQVIQLEDGTTAYIHQVTIQKGEASWHVPVQREAWQPTLRHPPWLQTPDDGWCCSLYRVFLL